MVTITRTRKLLQKGGFVTISRKEYEEFLAFKKGISVVQPTREEMGVIRRGEKEIQEGKYVEWTKLKQELARRRH